jgi:Nucleotidyl transferase AbiEii toxin, Type IV TA system
VKVEPNETIRGSVFPCEMLDISPQVEEEFGLFMTVQNLSIADLYGGKICAALDRQHPRDLFDVMLLLANEGLTPDIRKAFLVYLISHNRPMAEVLQPNRAGIDITELCRGYGWGIIIGRRIQRQTTSEDFWLNLDHRGERLYW